MEAAHGWVAVTGSDDLMQEFLPGMDPAKPFFLIQYNQVLQCSIGGAVCATRCCNTCSSSALG